MRALYLEDLQIQDEYVLREEPLHHLVNVVRVEKNEELLLLNGKGLSVKTVVTEAHKRELRLKKIHEIHGEKKFVLDLAIGMPKRDALELSLKEATEIGFSKIFLVKSEYSQMKFPETERIKNLLVSALEQSNALFLPEVIQASWQDIKWEEYDKVVMLDSQTDKTENKNVKASRQMLVVGPEGGFSPGEIDFLHSQKQIEVLNLPTPILRTPTAVAVGAGVILQNLLK